MWGFVLLGNAVRLRATLGAQGGEKNPRKRYAQRAGEPLDTPALPPAGLTDHVWKVSEIVSLLGD